MTTEKEIINDLHAIRERLYEETKHMSPEERLEFEKRDLVAQVEKLGIELKRPSSKNREPVTR